jgi:hypothetical protein
VSMVGQSQRLQNFCDGSPVAGSQGAVLMTLSCQWTPTGAAPICCYRLGLVVIWPNRWLSNLLLVDLGKSGSHCVDVLLAKVFGQHMSHPAIVPRAFPGHRQSEADRLLWACLVVRDLWPTSSLLTVACPWIEVVAKFRSFWHLESLECQDLL